MGLVLRVGRLSFVTVEQLVCGECSYYFFVTILLRFLFGGIFFINAFCFFGRGGGVEGKQIREAICTGRRGAVAKASVAGAQAWL